MTSDSKTADLGMAFQEPPALPDNIEDSGDDHAYTLKDVEESDTVFKEISIDFENAGLKVVKVEKLRNTHLLKRYVTERNLMLEQRKKVDPEFKLNEKYLYHGTSVVKASICEEGLDSRMSKQGCFGKGIYFSDYPKKCIKYAEKGGKDEYFILLMRVMLGQAKVYAKGKKEKNLVREPEKEAPFTGYKFYDSVEGCPVNHKEFVVYESRRALVDCIITYRRADQPAATDGSETVQPIELSYLDYSDTSDSDNEIDGADNQEDDGATSSDDEPCLDAEQVDVVIEDPGSSDDDEKMEVDTGKEGIVRTETVLQERKKEFKEKTGVEDEYVIDHCLLKSNLNIPEAIKVYEDMPKDKELKEIELPKHDVDLDLDVKGKSSPPPADTPSPDSDQWKQMSKADQDAVIEGLVEDFLHVTGLGKEEEPYAKKWLTQTKNNLDLAIIGHYEEMAAAAGKV